MSKSDRSRFCKPFCLVSVQKSVSVQTCGRPTPVAAEVAVDTGAVSPGAGLPDEGPPVDTAETAGI